MAGRFIKTSNMNEEMPNLLASNAQGLYNNPYYLFNNASRFGCTYYNLNTTMTTLDEATRGNYAELSPESPLRYNQINNFIIYGVNRIEPNLVIGDFGLEGNDITGDAFVLPKTIIPYPNDFFTLDQIGEKFLFKVTDVQPNMLDTGATMYKINYILSSSDGVEHIAPQVAKKFNFAISNYGSNFGCLIESSVVAEASELERYTVMLKDYYIQLFYNPRIQTFSYVRNGTINCHDPFLLEFMIRNKTLEGSTEYLKLMHQVYLPNTFGIDYDKTFFSALENEDLSRDYKTVGNLELCTQKLSLLYAYASDYYVMRYDALAPKFFMIDIFDDPAFISKCRSGDLTDNILKNIIIYSFNGVNITEEDLNQIKNVDFMSNAELYYLIPMVIFCIEKYITQLLSGTTST